MADPIFTQGAAAVKGVFSAAKAKLMLGTGLTGVLVQGLNFMFQQQVTRLYELGNSGNITNIYYVGGRCQGQAQLNRVIGPSATITALYSTYGDVCKGCSNNLTLSLTEANCCAGGSSATLSYTLKFCVLYQIGVSLNAQDLIINETGQIMFSGLDYTSSGA